MQSKASNLDHLTNRHGIRDLLALVAGAESAETEEEGDGEETQHQEGQRENQGQGGGAVGEK